MGGGIALGEAMKLSGLMELASATFSSKFSTTNFWLIIFIISIIESFVVSLINHTGAAALLFPILYQISRGNHNSIILIILSDLMILFSMLFHISSFPNAIVLSVQKHSRLDYSSLTFETFLSGKDFFKYGILPTLIGIFINCSLGFFLVKFILS
jgi:phosphate transporter